MMQKKLMYGLGLSALVEDVDDAGYLGLEESNAAQQARIDFGAYCEGLAAEYLHADGHAALAKQRLRDDLRKIGTGTDTGRLNEDKSALLGRFAIQLEEAIERLSNKAVWQSTMILLLFRTPRIVIVLIVVAALAGITILVGNVFAK